MALNQVLTLPKYRSRRADSGRILLLKKVISASSYGRTKVRIEFWSQCRILRVWTLVNRPYDVEYRRIPLNTVVEYR